MMLFRSTVVFVAILPVLFLSLQGQTPTDYQTPDRGISPYASYNLSEVEAIDTRTGALTLSIPLAGLPGRGGQSYTLSYIYNNHLWDMFNTFDLPTCPSPIPACPSGGSGWESYQQEILNPDLEGGWVISGDSGLSPPATLPTRFAMNS